MTASGLALGLLAACAAAGPPPAPEQAVVTETSDLALSVTARGSTDEVVLSWALENKGAASVWLADLLVGEDAGGPKLLPDRAVVRQPPAEGAPLRVTVGYTAPYGMMFRELYPVIREVGAASTATGQVRIPLPLSSFHPMEARPTPIERRPERVVVQVGVFRSAPATNTVRLGSGEIIKTLAISSLRDQGWIEAELPWP